MLRLPVKKTTYLSLAILICLLGLGAFAIWYRGRGGELPPRDAPAARAGSSGLARGPALAAPGPRPHAPLAPQGRTEIEEVKLAGGAVAGRVINRATGDPVVGAELTFTGAGGATTVRSGAAGEFELAPPTPGLFTLAAISAPGFMPYAPELLHSTVRIRLAKDRAIRGLTVFLIPAIDYGGRVVDERGAPAAGAKVRLLGTPAGEQAIDRLETEWVTDRDGAFRFHAADDAVLEAVRGGARGWAVLDSDAQLTRQLTIRIGEAPARDATITGHVVDEAGAPIPDALVRARPEDEAQSSARTTAFAITDEAGAFALEGLDRGPYELAAEAEDRAPVRQGRIAGGARGISLVLGAGLSIAGTVVASDGREVPAYTLLALRREGARRDLVLARSFVDPAGRFEVRVPAGDYDLIASARGWAPSAPVTVPAGTRDARLTVTAGATLRGRVVAAGSGDGIPAARIRRETQGGGASPQPANAGTITRADGTFELTGLPPGPVAITIAADGYHPKIEAGLVATEDAQLGPITIALQHLAEGERPSLELVGIGALLNVEGDGLGVKMVVPGSGAAAAGIAVGDLVIAIDGVPVAQLGLEGAIARIRGLAGTTVSVTLRREGAPVILVVERRKLRA